MKETLENSQSFEPGDLMPWHEMSRLLLVIQAELSDIKTRLDDLETAVGDLQPAIDLADFVPTLPYTRSQEQSDLANAAYYDEVARETGTHPSTCRCAWCEPVGFTGWS